MKPALTPGVYPGLPMEAYLSMHAVSASILQAVIEECPLAAWHQSWLNPNQVRDDGSDAQRTGTIAHSLVLEGGDMSKVAVIDPNLYPTKSTGSIPENLTQNKDIKAARDSAIAAGKTPILKPKMAIISSMVEVALTYIESLRESEPEVWKLFQPSGGDSEVTMVHDDDGMLCRIRPDRISKDRRVIGDYKTTKATANPDQWGRTQLIGMGYYTSAAFYRFVVQELTGEIPDYVYLVQEQEAPFLCSLVGIEPKGYELGALKITYARELWKQCVAANHFPGYPARAAYPEIPAWESARWEGKVFSRPTEDRGAVRPVDMVEMQRVYDHFEELETGQRRLA